MKLFDEKTGNILLDEIVFNLKSFQDIIEDGVITDEEMEQQTVRVVNLLKNVDEKFGDEDKKLVIDAVCEFAALYELAFMKYSMQVSKDDFCLPEGCVVKKQENEKQEEPKEE